VKFLCEHCKAKYQIADDKVAGRTVRMKCRKCGGAIEVRAAVTETSVAMKAGDVAGEGGGANGTGQRPAHRPSQHPGGRAGGQNDRALAGAFQRSVHREDEAAQLNSRELSAADEWYVAVNGVPVGPVRIGEVRRKAALGAVTEDSLCWQEGMEEWRAIRTVTELAAVVREAASGGRASLLPPAPGASGGSRPAPPRAAPRPQANAAPAWAKPAAAHNIFEEAEPEDEGAATIVGRSPLLDQELEAHGVAPAAVQAPPPAAVAPAAQAGAGPAAGATNGVARGTNDMFRPAAPPGPSAAFAPAGQPYAQAPQPFAQPFAQPPAPFGQPPAPFGQQPPYAPQPYAPPQPVGPPAAQGSAQGYPAIVAPPIVVPTPQRRMSPIVFGMIVMFGCFGLAAAYFVFSPRPTPAPIAQAPTAKPPPSAAGPAATDIPPVSSAPSPSAEPVAAASADAGARVASTTPRVNNGVGTAPANPTLGTKPVIAANPDLQSLINGTSTGPSAGPTGNAGGGGGAQLTEAEIQSVVSSHSVAVRRTCWDRGSPTTPSANINVHIVVAGSGNVSAATATGNDPVVAHCLEEEVKRWHWPGGGEMNVPFHFLRQ
jgi:predicted Zn finger-like uncharacterized protein